MKVEEGEAKVADGATNATAEGELCGEDEGAGAEKHTSEKSSTRNRGEKLTSSDDGGLSVGRLSDNLGRARRESSDGSVGLARVGESPSDIFCGRTKGSKFSPPNRSGETHSSTSRLP